MMVNNKSCVLGILGEKSGGFFGWLVMPQGFLGKGPFGFF